jgi:hypothetical protein
MTIKVVLNATFFNEKDEIITKTSTTGSISEVLNVPLSNFEAPIRDLALQAGRDWTSNLLKLEDNNAPICPICEAKMKKLGNRKKKIVTLCGETEYERGYYVCENCNTHYSPKDDLLGVKGTSFSPEVKTLTARIAANETFAETSSLLWDLGRIRVSAKDCQRVAENAGEEIMMTNDSDITKSLTTTELVSKTPIKRIYYEVDGTGVPIIKKLLEGVKGKQEDGSAKTREMKVGCIFTQTGVDKDFKPVRDEGSTTYLAKICSKEDFGPMLYAEAFKRMHQSAEEMIIIADGAKWCWNLADTYFPGATQIVDLFHAKEHVSKLIKEIVSDPLKQKEKKEKLYELLEKGKIDELVTEFTQLGAKTDEQLQKVTKESNYFIGNKDRMQYEKFRKKSLFVGSGVIEAACKHVIGKRLKQSGMHWSVKGANKIAALRCKELSKPFYSNFDAKDERLAA